MTDDEIKAIINGSRPEFLMFLERIKNLFLLAPEMNKEVHSIKARIKEESHIIDKVRRKENRGIEINAMNIFSQITDIAGVRVLHLYSGQFVKIHEYIKRIISEGELYKVEEFKAYTWDPETNKFFQSIGLNTEIKESYYTSIHYLVAPRSNSDIKCEIQVRNLFEEVWGEVEHQINYPNKTDNKICLEQIKVLARLSSTGTKLVDSIYLSK